MIKTNPVHNHITVNMSSNIIPDGLLVQITIGISILEKMI